MMNKYELFSFKAHSPRIDIASCIIHATEPSWKFQGGK